MTTYANFFAIMNFDSSFLIDAYTGPDLPKVYTVVAKPNYFVSVGRPMTHVVKHSENSGRVGIKKLKKNTK